MSSNKMQISLIAAMDRNRLIGANNQLPWHLAADLQHFKQLTWGKPILMGHKTFNSIGKPLPGRRNIILSHDSRLMIAGCEVASSLAEALELTKNNPELMVIGGRTVYELALPYATHLYLTLIDASFEGDTYFPDWNPAEWQLSQETPREEAGLKFTFATYEHCNLSSRS